MGACVVGGLGSHGGRRAPQLTAERRGAGWGAGQEAGQEKVGEAAWPVAAGTESSPWQRPLVAGEEEKYVDKPKNLIF